MQGQLHLTLMEGFQPSRRFTKYLLLLTFALFVLYTYIKNINTTVTLGQHLGTAIQSFSHLQFMPSSVELAFKNGTYTKEERSLYHIKYLSQFIRGPSGKPLQLDDPDKVYFSQAHQDEYVDKLLHNKTGGFFIECGAADGEQFSNTLYFERERGWTGLLVEANPLFYSKLLERQRKATLINACLSVTGTTQQVTFRPVGLFGGIDGTMDDTHKRLVTNKTEYYTEIRVQCFPIMDIMTALGRNHVDFFSLDVEGPELDILQTIDFNKLHIDVMSIEYRLFDGTRGNLTGSVSKLESLRKHVLGTGLYKEVGILAEKGIAEDKFGLDVVFMRNDVTV